jgi:hypothetical protein
LEKIPSSSSSKAKSWEEYYPKDGDTKMDLED